MTVRPYFEKANASCGHVMLSLVIQRAQPDDFFRHVVHLFVVGSHDFQVAILSFGLRLRNNANLHLRRDMHSVTTTIAYLTVIPL